MPCSSSETGAGSNWESCCTALTAFLSAPAPTSSRTEGLLSSGGRSRARAPRLTRPGGGIGAPVLRSAVASSFPARGISILPSTPPGVAAVRAFPGGENGGGRADSEVRRTFSSALADSAGQIAPASAVARNEDPLSSSPVSPSDAAAVECSSLRRRNGGSDVEVVRSGGQDESAHRGRGATSENAVLACAASEARPAMATPVTCTGFVHSFAASSADALIASVGSAGAAFTSTEATSAVPNGGSGGNVGSAVRHGCSLVNADETSGDTGTDFTQWRTWRNVPCGGVRAPLQIETTQRTRASSASTGGCGPTTLLRSAETDDLLLVQPASQQLSRQAHAAPPAVRAEPASHENSERETAPERGFPVAQPVDPAAVVGVETGRGIRPPLSGRGVRGRAVAHSASAPGQVCAARETSGVNVVGAVRGSAADRELEGYAFEGVSSRSTDRGEACVAAGSVGAATAVDKGAEAPADENTEDAERSDASQVVFYSPERSPLREAEADAASLLLFGVETQQGKTRPQEPCLSLSFAGAPQTSRVLQKQGSEEIGCSTAASAIMHGHAQLEVSAEELCTSLLSAGALAEKALQARAGRQERRSAGPPARTVLPEIIFGSGRASPAPPSQSINVSSIVQDRAGDDAGMLVIRAEAVEVPTKGLLLPRPASRIPGGGLAYVTASEPSAARGMRGRAHCEHPTERSRRGHTPAGSVALVGGSESEGDFMLQRTATTRAVASVGSGGAAETVRKGRLMAAGLSSRKGKRAGQSTRQLSAQFGGEESSDSADYLLAGERVQPSRRGRCQRPTSWKRVRQLTGEGQLPSRGSGRFICAASHAVGRADNMQSKGLEPPQKWCGKQRSLEGRAAKIKPTASRYERKGGETPSTNSNVAGTLQSEQSGSPEKHSGKATGVIGGQRESGAPAKPIVPQQTAVSTEGSRASKCEAGTEGPGTSPKTSTLVSDQGKEEADLSTTGLCLVGVSPAVTALGAEGRSTGTPLEEGNAGLENKECLSNSDPRVLTVVTSGTADDDSRKRSIGPGEFASFDEDTSGDESSVSAGEAGGPAWPRVISLQKPPHSQLRVPGGRGAVFAEAECLPAASLSTRMQALRPPELGCSPGDVDEDEALRFFKRRRCSLLLWGGIRNDRGHSAAQQASLDAPTPTDSAPTSRDPGDAQKDSADNVPGVNTTSARQVERAKQRQETPGSISAIASHKQCVHARSQPETTDERAAEKRRDEGSSGEESAGIAETGANADLVAPTVRRGSEAPASPLGTPAGFTSRLLRKRKRGVGACASRLLFLQRPGAGASSEDAALVNSLSSALTYEETQQLRRVEHEQRQLELLRQQEEARRKEQAAAARLREQQKAAAAVIAAAASARTLPSCPFIFGSATAAVAPTSGGDAVGPATLPAQGETHRATALVAESASDTALTRNTKAPSQPETPAESTSAHVSVPGSLSCERRPADQSVEQQPQTKEAVSSGRPKLRIIRSPAAGDTAVSALSAGDAGGGLAGPAVGGAAVGPVVHAQSSEGSSGSAASSLQQAELPAAFGGGCGGVPPSCVGGLFAVAQQPQMRAGILPAEFGGVAGGPGAAGTGVAGSGGFGIGSAFGVTSAGPSPSAANPFAFQRGGRGLRKGGSGRRR